MLSEERNWFNRVVGKGGGVLHKRLFEISDDLIRRREKEEVISKDLLSVCRVRLIQPLFPLSVLEHVYPCCSLKCPFDHRTAKCNDVEFRFAMSPGQKWISLERSKRSKRWSATRKWPWPLFDRVVGWFGRASTETKVLDIGNKRHAVNVQQMGKIPAELRLDHFVTLISLLISINTCRLESMCNYCID